AVYIMITAIEKLGFDIYNRISGNYTISHGFFNAGPDCRDKFTWNSTALYAVNKFKAFTGLVLGKPQYYVSILATAAVLADVFAFGLGTVFSDCLTISNMGLAHISLNAEFALHSIYNYFQM